MSTSPLLFSFLSSAFTLDFHFHLHLHPRECTKHAGCALLAGFGSMFGAHDCVPAAHADPATEREQLAHLLTNALNEIRLSLYDHLPDLTCALYSKFAVFFTCPIRKSVNVLKLNVVRLLMYSVH